jgi:hypothetical protein
MSECPTCGDCFKSEHGVKLHHANSHGESLAYSEYECEICGDTFERKDSEAERRDEAFCSRECYNNRETTAVTFECPVCGETGERKRSEYERWDVSVCSNECRAEWLSESQRGDENPNYVHGGDRERFTEYERTQIFERDDYTCQDCGERGGTLAAHHVEYVSENPDRAHDIDNGVTLCDDCHAERHNGEQIYNAMLK